MIHTRRVLLSLAVAIGLCVPVRPSLAATGSSPEAAPGSPPQPATGSPPQPATDPRVTELQAMHAAAQQRIERYNATLDPSHLDAARELLARWLVEHRALYGDTPAASAVRAPIEQQLGTLEAELVRVRGTTTPMPAVAPVAAPAPMPAPRPAMTPDEATRLRRARGLVTAGATATVVGGLTLVAASLPLWLLRDRALRRANEQTFYVDEQRLLSRARRRHAGAIATLAVGTTLAAAGVTMMTVGGIQRLRLRRELVLAPEFGPGFAGASATLRF